MDEKKLREALAYFEEGIIMLKELLGDIIPAEEIPKSSKKQLTLKKVKQPFRPDQFVGHILQTINVKEFLCAEMLAQRLRTKTGYDFIDISEKELIGLCRAQIESWQKKPETLPPGVVVNRRYGFDPTSPKAATNKRKGVNYEGEWGVKRLVPPSVARPAIVKVLGIIDDGKHTRYSKDDAISQTDLIREAYEVSGSTVRSKYDFTEFTRKAKDELSQLTNEGSSYKGYILEVSPGMYKCSGDRRTKNKK